MKLSRGGYAYDAICESAQDDEGFNASYGLFGSAYVATAGMPLEDEVERALLSYLFNEKHEAPDFDVHEVEAYIGRRARVTRRDGSTLVGTIKKPGGDRIAVAGRDRARQIRFADIVKVELAPDGVPDTD